jgi:Ser/Thr protein kinase RdoA (MazF antagonist)
MQIDPLLADPIACDGLTGIETRQLRGLAPRLRAMCAELAAYQIPQTLVHGDLHGDNVAARDGHTLVFDWTDACLSHPFFDLMTTLFADEATQTQLWRAYLDCFSEYEPPERLLAAWALARPLCALHHAVSYQSITANLEPRTRGEFAGDTIGWLRRVLQLMP